MLYFRAQRILMFARGTRVFHMLNIHIARQALHLVILLNELAYTEDGLDDQHMDERETLEECVAVPMRNLVSTHTSESDLIEIESAMKDWSSTQGFRGTHSQGSLTIKMYYSRVFRERFYFKSSRDPQKDLIYQRLLAYDTRGADFFDADAEDASVKRQLLTMQNDLLDAYEKGSEELVSFMNSWNALKDRIITGASAHLLSTETLQLAAEVAKSVDSIATSLLNLSAAGTKLDTKITEETTGQAIRHRQSLDQFQQNEDEHIKPLSSTGSSSLNPTKSSRRRREFLQRSSIGRLQLLNTALRTPVESGPTLIPHDLPDPGAQRALKLTYDDEDYDEDVQLPTGPDRRETLLPTETRGPLAGLGDPASRTELLLPLSPTQKLQALTSRLIQKLEILTSSVSSRLPNLIKLSITPVKAPPLPGEEPHAISAPFGVVHKVSVTEDPQTGQLLGLPEGWQMPPAPWSRDPSISSFSTPPSRASQREYMSVPPTWATMDRKVSASTVAPAGNNHARKKMGHGRYSAMSPAEKNNSITEVPSPMSAGGNPDWHHGRTMCTGCNTPTWGLNPEDQPLCYMCGLFLKHYGVTRTPSLKTGIIKKRNPSGDSLTTPSPEVALPTPLPVVTPARHKRNLQKLETAALGNSQLFPRGTKPLGPVVTSPEMRPSPQSNSTTKTNQRSSLTGNNHARKKMGHGRYSDSDDGQTMCTDCSTKITIPLWNADGQPLCKTCFFKRSVTPLTSLKTDIIKKRNPSGDSLTTPSPEVALPTFSHVGTPARRKRTLNMSMLETAALGNDQLLPGGTKPLGPVVTSPEMRPSPQSNNTTKTNQQSSLTGNNHARQKMGHGRYSAMPPAEKNNSTTEVPSQVSAGGNSYWDDGSDWEDALYTTD